MAVIVVGVDKALKHQHLHLHQPVFTLNPTPIFNQAKMGKGGLSPTKLNLNKLSDPSERYTLGELLGTGIHGNVYSATDNENSGMKVAVKIQKITPDRMDDIQEEYRVLRDLSSHPNLPDFYGVYLEKTRDGDQLWFVMQLCEGGPVVDVVRGLLKHGKKMSEEHIAFILHETVKALVHLHENHVMHRDVRGSNILLTKLGEVKLVDFGLSRELKSTMDKRNTVIGSPSWMAPEVVTSERLEGTETNAYDNRADVWALGITAIELGDGKAPFEGIHPTRALFQIVRNPPPTLYRPASWTQNFNDFINECLEKNPENRPFMVEIMEHPFLTQLPENDFHLTHELKSLLDMVNHDIISTRREEVVVNKKFMKTKSHQTPEVMHVEDLAALEDITEDTVLSELQERTKEGHCYSFIGDVLLFLNPNSEQDIYSFENQTKYFCKSRSDNAPHIYSVADSAFQDAFHHEEPQHIILSGETLSGKTTNLKHLLNHLNYLGLSPNKVGDKLIKALSIIHTIGNAATPVNADSTRHIMMLQVTFSSTGKTSGGIFWVYQLEKWRVTGCPVRAHANFHIFYYLYDYLESEGTLDQFSLDGGRNYRYLGTAGSENDSKVPFGPREEPHRNPKKFKDFEKCLIDLEFDQYQRERIYKTVAAILLLGEVKFEKAEDGKAGLANTEVANKVANLLDVDEKKFCWALCNYCLVVKGTAQRRKHSVEEAREAREVLARGLYFRLVDWIVNTINLKLSFTRAMFGDRFYINLLDLFGFECYPKNSLEQLFVNTVNEQLQYHYNQRIFVWEMQEQIEENIPLQPLQYYDNKPTIDELMSKPDGLLYIVDESNKNNQGADFIIEKLQSTPKGPRVKMSTSKEFTVAHYTGKIAYDVQDMPIKNRDFLPPEMIETMRLSNDEVIKQLFTNQLSKSGNLTVHVDQSQQVTTGKKKRWGAALVAERQKRSYNTQSRGEYSQTRRMRTGSATFRAASLELLRNLAMGQDGCVALGGTHFVRCIRADLTGSPYGFQPDVVRQQLRALAVIDTARARAKGYSHRVGFAEFIRRYKFLAFDFDENVEVTKDNCRLLLVRLKMEGWVIGKSKVFLKYYNEEYLSRLYETQVKKIIKVQCMMRAFLAKRNFKGKVKARQDSIRQQSQDEEGAPRAEPAEFRGYQARKEIKPLLSGEKMNNEDATFIKQFCRKWKAKSIFQVLLMYRAAKHQEIVYMSQQVHLYNQNAVSALQICNKERVSLHNIRTDTTASQFLGKFTPRMWKLPFRLNDMPFVDSSYLCNTMGKRTLTKDDAPWDDPYKRRSRLLSPGGRTSELENRGLPVEEGGDVFGFIQTPYTRDPNYVEVVYSGQPYRKGDHFFTTKTPKQRRASRKDRVAPPAPQLTYNYAQPGGSSDFSKGFNRPAAPSYQPPSPSKNFVNQQYNNDSGNNNYRDKLKPVGGNQNPIRELEMKFQQINNNKSDNEDEAPTFNFQAMLRKTNHNRASLRRSPEMEMANSHGYGSFPVIPEQRSVSQSNSNGYMNNNNNVVYNSSAMRNKNAAPKPFLRQDSGDCRKNMSHHYKESVKKARCDEVTTEIAPGIIIQGQVAEL
ncbi:neither inactivation nor afterpotential protein C isoform X3 [Macrosteles quadrilineatus]|uniref:neither inactivation nor afterpotential protein C isoform X3 n=1 Tax=Macrosteles quadrilineatus TaxID=74068 RepID=UPI0023E34FB2|nr:neither inactivation nor afterpotential protein C isoform X3 [Macrosteles quadrilineatus]